MSKPLKFHQTLNLPPRSITHGQHRRSSPPAHGNPVVGTDHSAGGSSQSIAWVTLGNPFSFFTFDDPKPPAIPHAGIRTGELTGHRLWWVIRDQDGPWLCSLAHRRLWIPGETVAGDTAKPVERDDWLGMWTIWGGVYAFGSAALLTTEIEFERGQIAEFNRVRGFVSFGGWHGLRETTTFAAGTLKMWGEVVEHERGYRAQFAKLASIDQVFGDAATLDELRAKYLSSATEPLNR